mgnify:FL=1
MKKGLFILLSLIVFTTVNADVLTAEKQKLVPNIYTKNIDENNITDQQALPKILRNNRTYRSAQNPNVTSVLIDSSVHGYGMVVGQTSPTTFVDTKGLLIGYRGWVLEPFTDEQGNASSANNSGFIKAALSEDGIDFSIYSEASNHQHPNNE